ncbi:MAG: deoxyguanosinetriphosphate triphosphohydrolase [Clostridia bacterium]|nr:deoxyguanosinetriphosphate triphosphohydrolase [Clostridia bacterium]
MVYRQRRELWEKEHLGPNAFCSADSRGRAEPLEPCPMRTCFCRDRDRIIHSKAFRRLKHKTQVFLSPQGDHYRTRLIHTLEVSQISRDLARALQLNEDLTEAIALGHDLGHTPFGHAGERILNQICSFEFSHNEQSVRTCAKIEKLNLTHEVLDGIRHHTGDGLSETLEGRIVRIADRIAYVNHDIDDAIRGGIIRLEDLPPSTSKILGNNPSQRINTMIIGILSASTGKNDIVMDPVVLEAMNELRTFLFDKVYFGSRAKKEETKAQLMIAGLFHYFMEHTDKIPEEYAEILQTEGKERAVCDYIAGMSDVYSVGLYKQLFIPKSWEG